MNLGDRVCIVNPSAKYKFLIGAIGTVERIWKGKSEDPIGVLVDNIENANSRYGIFWFSKGSIKLIKEEKHMNKDFSVATVKFLNGSNAGIGYAYALYDNSISVGDIVVVNTGHHGMAVARVSAVNEADCSEVRCGREVVCKVDLTAFNERKEKAARIAALEKEMQAKAAEVQTMAIYEMMAEKSPELRIMLDEYKKLTAGEAEKTTDGEADADET